MELNYRYNERKRVSIQKRTLAIADNAVNAETKTLALTSHMDSYTLESLLRHLDDVEDEVETLSLYRMNLDHCVSHEVVQQLFRWNQVELDDCEGDHFHAVIAGILRHDNIQRLRVFFGYKIDPEVVDALGKGLPQSKLQELSLTIDMDAKTARILCHSINLSKLTKCNLNRCGIYADAVDVLCRGLEDNTTLELLRLEYCRLRDDEVADLVRAVKHHPTLQELSFRGNYAQEDSIDTVAELLRCTPALRRLDLAQQNPGILDLSQLAQALEENTTLVHLNLQESFLKDIHIPALVRALSINTTLRQLNMENCELKDAGLSALIEGLGEFRGLAQLWLRENNFHQSPDESVILRSLERNHTLQVLDLDDEWTLSSSKYPLYLNRSGRKFLTNNNVAISLWPTLLARAHSLFKAEEANRNFREADIIYYLLHGPALLER
jgi:Ran GTPase-activating protein (RanGAP) involved in mRNA processing and transport